MEAKSNYQMLKINKDFHIKNSLKDKEFIYDKINDEKRIELLRLVKN